LTQSSTSSPDSSRARGSLEHNGQSSSNFPTAPCMIDTDHGKTCQKRFPKGLIPKRSFKKISLAMHPHFHVLCAQEDVDAYMQYSQAPRSPLHVRYYRRRDNGAFFTKTIRGQTVTFDNHHVVPYNPYLRRKSQSHIIVEICASNTSIICKGTDRSTIQLSSYQILRWVKFA